MCSPTVQYISMNKQNIFEGPEKLYYFSAILKSLLSILENILEQKESIVQPKGNNEGRKEIL